MAAAESRRGDESDATKRIYPGGAFDPLVSTGAPPSPAPPWPDRPAHCARWGSAAAAQPPPGVRAGQLAGEGPGHPGGRGPSTHTAAGALHPLSAGLRQG